MPTFRIIGAAAATAAAADDGADYGTEDGSEDVVTFSIDVDTLRRHGGILEALATTDDEVVEIRMADCGLRGTARSFRKAADACYPKMAEDATRGIHKALVLSGVVSIRACDIVSWLGCPLATPYSNKDNPDVRGFLGHEDGSCFGKIVRVLEADSDDDDAEAIEENKRAYAELVRCSARDEALEAFQVIEHRIDNREKLLTFFAQAARDGYLELCQYIIEHSVPADQIEALKTATDEEYRIIDIVLEEAFEHNAAEDESRLEILQWIWNLPWKEKISFWITVYHRHCKCPDVLQWLMLIADGLDDKWSPSFTNDYDSHVFNGRVWALEIMWPRKTIDFDIDESFRLLQEAVTGNQIEALRFLVEKPDVAQCVAQIAHGDETDKRDELGVVEVQSVPMLEALEALGIVATRDGIQVHFEDTLKNYVEAWKPAVFEWFIERGLLVPNEDHIRLAIQSPSVAVEALEFLHEFIELDFPDIFARAVVHGCHKVLDWLDGLGALNDVNVEEGFRHVYEVEMPQVDAMRVGIPCRSLNYFWNNKTQVVERILKQLTLQAYRTGNIKALEWTLRTCGRYRMPSVARGHRYLRNAIKDRSKDVVNFIWNKAYEARDRAHALKDADIAEGLLGLRII